MLRFVVSLTITSVLVTSAAIATGARPALACSGGADWDPVVESDVIVGGQVGAWKALPERGLRGMFVPVRLDVRIDHVWKGTADAPIVDNASLLLQPTGFDGGAVSSYEVNWAGGAGACGVLDEDPSGMYVVLGLGRDENGELRTNRLTTFYIAAAPYDAADVPRLSGAMGLPRAGGGGADQERWGMLVAAIGGTLVIGGLLLKAHALLRV